MKDLAQNALLGGVALLVAATIWVLKPVQPLTAHGILLPQQATELPALPTSAVRIYTNPPTAPYQVVGIVRTMHHFSTLSAQESTANFKANLAYATQLAAAAGANGLLLQEAGETAGGVNPLDAFELNALAIEVPTTNSP